MTPASYVELFGDRHVLVIGDVMLDSYLAGSSDRLCQEAPVPVVAVSARTDVPGGAANAAVNVSALGAQLTLLSVIGSDAEGQALRASMSDLGIASTEVVVDGSRRTLAKQRVMAGAQLLVRFDQGTTDPPSEGIEDALVESLRKAWVRCDAVLVSDYAYGVMSPRVIAELRALQQERPRLVVVDAKDLTRYRAIGATAVKPNYSQVAALLQRHPTAGRGRAEGVVQAAELLLEATGAQIAAVTLDTEGAVVLERDRAPYRTFARPMSDARAAGAGDTFVSAFTLALASGAHTPAAAELASRAAAIVVGKDKTAACSALELRESYAVASKHLTERSRLAERIEFLRRQGRRIVFTNGCFDILHRGHITLLNRAKMLGDVLVVGVNSDGSVARLKGAARPINALEDRVQVLAALSSVDHIVAFDEDTPVALVEAIKPDVFVKGGDYTVDMLPEARVVEANGGVVQILGFVEDRSTSGIIERIRGSEAPSHADA